MLRSNLSLASIEPKPVAMNHTVQFYEDDAFLCDTVARFVGAGLAAGEAVVVIATDLHVRIVLQRLKANDFDVDRARQRGRLVFLDARDTLSRFMVGGMPDWESFRSVIGGVFEQCAGERTRVRAYGEMVDLLWRDGSPQAALRLEQMWNDLARHHQFTLLCAYVMGSFTAVADGAGLREICDAHSHVGPAEDHIALEDPDARLRQVSALQQRARALEQLLAEQAHRGEQSEERFRLLVESVVDYAVFMLNATGHVETWNTGAERLKGYRADEIIGEHFSRFYPEEDVRAGKCEMELEIAARDGRFEDEGWRVRKDGSRFWANVIISRMVDRKTGKLRGFAKVTRDLTERRKLELEQVGRNAAEAERTRLFKLFTEAPVAIALTHGPEHTIELANPVFCAIVGRSPIDLVGKPVRAAFPEYPPDAPPFAIADAIYRSGETFVAPEYPVRLPRTKGGVVEDAVVRFMVEPTKDANGVYGLMGMAIDVTDQARARESLQWALDEQKKTEELREQLIGVVGHDLRSPLSAISMAAALLLKKGTLGVSDGKLAARIARNADRMAKMISQLLDFTRSRLGGGIAIDAKLMDLADVCGEVIADIEIANPERVVRFDADATAVGMWDRERLAQVVANLVGNAIQYGSPGSPIDVHLTDDGDAVLLRVHNEGAPIPAEVQPSIFDPFRRGRSRAQRERSESLGLGLFIVREIVRAHGGAVAVESTAAEGTTFTVRLPRALAATA